MVGDIKICPECKKEVGKENIYCPYDGSSLHFKEIENVCVKCDKQYENTYTFCPVHGDKLLNVTPSSVNYMNEKSIDLFKRSICPECDAWNNWEIRGDESTCKSCNRIYKFTGEELYSLNGDIVNHETKESVELQIKDTEKSWRYKWGLGWFIVISVIGIGVQKVNFYSNIGNVFKVFIPFAILLPYFKMRNIFIKKYGDSELGKSSFISGLACYGILLALVMAFSFIDGMIYRSDLENMTKMMEIKRAEFLQEDNKIVKKINFEVEGDFDFGENIIAIDDYLRFINKKIKYFNGLNSKVSAMFDRKKDKKMKERWDKNYNVINRYNSTAKQTFENLQQYYLTGDEKYYNKFQQGIKEGTQLEIDIKKLASQTP